MFFCISELYMLIFMNLSSNFVFILFIMLFFCFLELSELIVSSFVGSFRAVLMFGFILYISCVNTCSFCVKRVMI